jgi:predicted Zn-dependent peptidase
MRAVSSEAPTRDGVLLTPRATFLDNGLKVPIEESHTAPLVSVWCWYHVASIDSEVAGMARDGVTDDELTSAKRYLVGSIPRSLETNEGIAQFLQTAELFDLGLDYDIRVPGLVQSVTVDDVAEAARRTLVTEQATIVIAGPYEDS